MRLPASWYLLDVFGILVLLLNVRAFSHWREFLVFFFFFSSRRRHTRLVSDWSSDVCSSDLYLAADGCKRVGQRRSHIQVALKEAADDVVTPLVDVHALPFVQQDVAIICLDKIGRASCRERV